MKLYQIRKVVFQISIAGLLLYWSAGISLIKVEYDHIIVSERENLRLICRTTAGIAARELDEIKLYLQELAAWLHYNDDADLRNNPELASLVSNFVKHKNGTINIKIVTNDGGMYYLPLTSREPLSDVSDREYFRAQQRLEAKGFFVASPVKSRVNGSWILPVSLPLEENRQGYSVLYAAVNLHLLDDLFTTIISGSQSAKITVIRDDGIILAKVPFDEIVLGSNIPDELFDLFNRKESGSAVIRDRFLRKGRRVLMYESVPGYPLKITVDMDYTVILSKWLFRSISRIIVHILSTALIIYLIKRFLNLLHELEGTQLQLEKLARYDGLTGLMNRKFFFERFNEEIERSSRYKSKMVLLAIDIDHFKKINDTYGHPEGDRVLSALGRIFKENIRSTDFAGRVGGEEFAIILSETSIKDGKYTAERIRNAAHSIELPGWVLTISIGMAGIQENDTAETIYSRADSALYSAKDGGRDCVCG